MCLVSCPKVMFMWTNLSFFSLSLSTMPCHFLKPHSVKIQFQCPLPNIHTLTKFRECQSRSRESKVASHNKFCARQRGWGDGGKDMGRRPQQVLCATSAMLNRFCEGNAEVLRSEGKKKGRRWPPLRGRRRLAVRTSVVGGFSSSIAFYRELGRWCWIEKKKGWFDVRGRGGYFCENEN